MMKKISFLMLFALSFLVLNCRTEDFHNEEVNQTISQPRLTSKRISLNESKHKAKLLTEIDKAEIALKNLSKTNIQGKVISYNNGVLIDTDEVLYIENGPNYHTYTFNLIRENALPTDPVENLVLSPLSDGTYKELLVSYNLSVQEKETLRNGGFVNTKGKTEVMELAKGTFNTNNQLARQVCTTSSTSYWAPCSGNQHHDGSNYESCPIYQGLEQGTPPIFYTIVTTTCIDQKDDVITPIDIGGGGGGGTYTPPANNNPPCTGTIIPTNPQPGFTDENGCPIAIPTQPYVVKSFNLIVRALPADVKALLNSNTQFYNGLQTYYNANPNQQGENFVQWAAQFSWENQNVTWAEFQPMLTFAHNFLQENPDTLNPEALFQRLKDLDDDWVQNPNKLLKIPCNQLPYWQDIAMHKIPQNVKIKLQNIPNQNSYWSSWNITNLDDGEGAHVNMDLFPVKISTMPKKPNSTQKYTPAEFFDFFRKNLNLFAEKFTPIENNYYNIHDTALWNSANPLGALIHIDITPDDGTVVCSGVSTNTWIFSTIKAPQGWSYDGVHPVSGNRAFSYYMDGTTMYIYTRGVDRTSKINDEKTPIVNYIMEAIAFSAADDLWTEMQNKLSKYVNDREGSSNVITPVKYRPNYDGIKNYLKGKIPISSVGCN